MARKANRGGVDAYRDLRQLILLRGIFNFELRHLWVRRESLGTSYTFTREGHSVVIALPARRVPRRTAALISAGGAVVEVTSGTRVARGVARIVRPPQRLRLARCLSRAGLAVRAGTDGRVRLPTVLPAPRLIDRAIGRCRSFTRWPHGFGSARTVFRLKERGERYAACARRLGFELGAPRLFLFDLGMGLGFARSPAGPAAVCGNVLPLRPQVARPKLHGANFWVKCRFSHFSNDDPIVYPGQPGRSHAHTFFGNRSTDAFSTPKSLRVAPTTCTRPADKAAYWVPTLFLDGRPVRPASVGIYHLMKTADAVRPFPPGLKMVAGDGGARRPQSERVTHWTCWLHSGPFEAVPRCPAEGAGRHGLLSRVPPVLTLHVTFPNCWDGRRLDSPDHKSHMAYMVSIDYGRCPRSHPVQVPGISLLIAYPIAGGRGVELSSGGQFSAHADFINAWDQRVLAAVVASCSRPGAKADCADEVERARR